MTDCETFELKKGSQLYKDMEDILGRAAKGQLRFYTYDEVFGGGDIGADTDDSEPTQDVGAAEDGS